MRSIAIMNQKGGVGKTTTSVNLSAALAEQGRRVALIDLDPQSHATLHLGVACEESDQTTYGLLTGDLSITDCLRPVGEHLDVVPAHLDLAAAEMELAGEVGREVILRDKLAEHRTPYDYVIFDCPPSLGLLTLNALAAAGEVLLPLQPHFLALHGLSKLLGTIDLVARRLNRRLRLTGVVFCMHEAHTRLANEVSEDVATFFEQSRSQPSAWSEARLFSTRIRRNIRLAESPSFGQSIFDYAPGSPGAVDYAQLCAEVLEQEAGQLAAA